MKKVTTIETETELVRFGYLNDNDEFIELEMLDRDDLAAVSKREWRQSVVESMQALQESIVNDIKDLVKQLEKLTAEK